MAKILIVEDEPHMLAGIRDNLEFEGYEVDTAADGQIGLNKIIENNYALILLDVMLPNVSGFDICKKIRKQGIKTPIIFLTAKSEEIDKVIGLESGGDDYITKPFSLRELLARIKAVLRRTEDVQSESGNTQMVEIGNLTINFENYNAFINNQPVKLSMKEFEILQFLFKNKNSTITRDTLLDKIWGYDYQPSSRTIDNFILKLRQKIEDDHNNPKYILTVHGIGYKLVLG